jgi:hypothetical protein
LSGSWAVTARKLVGVKMQSKYYERRRRKNLSTLLGQNDDNQKIEPTPAEANKHNVQDGRQVQAKGKGWKE